MDVNHSPLLMFWARLKFCSQFRIVDGMLAQRRRHLSIAAAVGRLAAVRLAQFVRRGALAAGGFAAGQAGVTVAAAQAAKRKSELPCADRVLP